MAQKLSQLTPKPTSTPDDSPTLILKERKVRFYCEKFALVISEISTPEEVFESINDSFSYENGSNNLMKESTKYDLAVSDKTSMYSSNIGMGKSQIEESIDLVCLEISNTSLKFDL